VSRHVRSRLQPDIATTFTLPGRARRAFASRAISPSVRPWTRGPGAAETMLNGIDGSRTGPSTRSPPSGFGLSSTTTSIPASAAASRQSSIVLA
jgi:hypothetical protein